MSEHRDAATIGAFVVGAVALVVTAVLVWGSGKLFRQTVEYVCYFEGSVNGLEVGAPVKARGVPVGKVVAIKLRYRQAADNNRIPVFIELDIKRLVELGSVRLPATPDVEQDLIVRGVRARLESQSIVTGTLFVGLGRFPGTPVVMSEIDPAHGYPEIPTLPTELAETGKAFNAVLERLKEVDLAGAVRSVDAAAASFDRLVSTGDLARALSEGTSTLHAYRRLADQLNDGVPPLLAEVRAATGDARKTLVGLDGAAGAAGRLVGPQAPLNVRLNEALTEFGRASNAIRELADYLRRNPNALLVGNAR
jgi:paraquat-inducible protein B